MKPMLVPYPREVLLPGGASALPENAPVTFTHAPDLPREAYELRTQNGAVQVAASSPAGEFYALKTLEQLHAVYGEACGGYVIRDAPALPYRGFLVDSCRHFYGVEELKRVIDAAACFKLNRFHWHLTDDQGWRIEIRRYPRLTEVGGRRSGSHFGGVDEGMPHAGYFTQAQIKEIVDHCAKRCIEVVPEIEMPGHFTAAIAAYPFLGCTGEVMEPLQKEGVYPNVLCVGNPEAVSFVHNVLDEVCALFPGKYVHVGGDEAPRTRWRACEKCAAEMRRRGITDCNALQGAFIKDTAAYLRKKGKTVITWNESLKGNCLSPDDVTVQRWMDPKNLCGAFAGRGGRLIDSDFYHYYFDYPYGMTPLRKAFAWDPFSGRGAQGLTGVECALWTEFVRTFPDLCEKLFPRLLAAAERGWSGEKRPYGEFRASAEALLPLLEKLNVPTLPPERWDPGAIARLKQVKRFFKGMLSPDLLRQARENRK